MNLSLHFSNFAASVIWKPIRKLINPSFSLKILRSFLPIFNAKIKILVENLDSEVEKPHFDLFPYLSACTLDKVLIFFPNIIIQRIICLTNCFTGSWFCTGILWVENGKECAYLSYFLLWWWFQVQVHSLHYIIFSKPSLSFIIFSSYSATTMGYDVNVQRNQNREFLHGIEAWVERSLQIVLYKQTIYDFILILAIF